MRKLALLLLLSGCVHRVDYGPTGRIDDPAVLLEGVKARYAAVHGLSGEGKIGADTPELRGTLKMAIEVQQPGSIYLETADILGNLRGVFATDGQSYGFWRADQNTFASGPASAENIGRYLPLPLSPSELADALLAEPPLLTPELMHLEVDESADAYVLTLQQGAYRQRLRIATRDQRLLSVENRGHASFDSFFEDHSVISGVLFPTTVRLRVPKARSEVLLRYTNIRLNPVSSPATFQLQPPPGSRPEGEPPPSP